MNAPRAGWHPDPTDRHDYRYWDGIQWTDDVSDGGVTAIDPVPDGSAVVAGAAAAGAAAFDGHGGWGDERPAPYTGGFGARRALGPGPSADPGPGPDLDAPGPRPGGFGEPDRYTAGYQGYQGHEQQEPTRYAGGGFGSGPGFGDQTTQYSGGFGGARDAQATTAWPSGEDRYGYRDPGYRSSSGGMLPGLPDRRGPSKTLLAGIGLVAVALIAGLAIVLTNGGGDGETADGTEISEDRDGVDGSEDRGSSETSDTTATTAAPGSTATTAPGGTTTTTAAPPATPPEGEGGGGGGGGDEAAAVQSIAQELQQRSQGNLTEEQSQCMAEGMVEALGPEAAHAVAGGGQPDPSQMTQEDMMALQRVVMDCGVAPGSGG